MVSEKVNNKGKKKILFFAIAPMNYMMFKPVHETLKKDGRIEISFTSKYQGRRGSKRLYEKVGFGRERIINYKLAGFRKFDLYISPDIMMVGKRAGIKIQMFHGISFKGVAYTEKISVYNKLFIIGNYMKRRFISKGILQENDSRFEMIGMPKLDRLVNGNLNREEIIKGLKLDSRLPTVIYAPTWSQKSSLYKIGEELMKTVSKMDVNFLIKLHDHSYDPRKNPVNWEEKLKEFTASNVRIIRDFDIVPYLFISDILITDLSSVSNEYLLLDRPIILIDSPELRKKFQDTIDMENWWGKTGVTVETTDQLKKAIQNSISNPKEYSEMRKKIAEDLFYKPGTATNRAVEAIYRYLEMEKI